MDSNRVGSKPSQAAGSKRCHAGGHSLFNKQNWMKSVLTGFKPFPDTLMAICPR